ncbi:MAG: 50S ribosomal protein L44e [Candidatus Heimdallarchaeota archaeon]|nr:50S ribosomal protein L44e [Candidatus Heimdallarchaeota archaeon]
MKIPAKMRTYCPNCKKHTFQDVKIEKARQRGGGMGHGSRRSERWTSRIGNHGRYSRRPIASRNMTSKTTKKVDLRTTCTECGKKWIRSRPRARRTELKRV